MLGELELQAVATHGVLLITTPDDADNVEEIRAYEVSDLVCKGSGPKDRWPDNDQLIDVIMSCVRPTRWQPGSQGPAAFTAVGVNVIVFSQYADVHDETEALLSQLRAVRHRSETASKPIEPRIPEAEAAIRRALAKPVELDYRQTPLEKVAADLRTKLGVPVLLNKRAIRDIGSSPDMSLTFAISRVQAKAAIELMVRPLSLAAVIQHDLLLITSIEEAECLREARVYDVSDLVADAGTTTRDNPDFKQLIELIETCVCPRSGRGAGAGTLRAFEAKGIKAIVTVQSQSVHGEIGVMLSQLRAAHHLEKSSASPVPPTAQGPNTPVRHDCCVATAGDCQSGNGRSPRPLRPISFQLKDAPLARPTAATK